MGFRFRKSIGIAPGVKINIGKSGVNSLSVGGRGATVNLNGKGARTTVGIPGSGLSYQTQRSSGGSGVFILAIILGLIGAIFKVIFH